MSYSPHTWTTGETISSSLLNHIELGIEAAQAAADRAQDARELRAAFDMLAGQTQAAIRELDRRVKALEEQ